MCNLKFNFETIKGYLGKLEQYKKPISEIDTQNILVEPILCIAGVDVHDIEKVKRANRSSKNQAFDIEVYKDENPIFAFEVKSIKSSEFNIKKDNNGSITISTSSKGRLFCKAGNNCKYENKSGDGLGQLRAYLLNFKKSPKNFKKSPKIAIFTNGRYWFLICKPKKFIENPEQEISQNELNDQNLYKFFDISKKEDFDKLIKILTTSYNEVEK